MFARGPSGKAQHANTDSGRVKAFIIRLDGVACELAKEYTVPYRFYAASTPHPGTCGIHFDFDTGDCMLYTAGIAIRPAPDACKKTTASDAALRPKHANAAATPLASDTRGLIRIDCICRRACLHGASLYPYWVAVADASSATCNYQVLFRLLLAGSSKRRRRSVPNRLAPQNSPRP